VTVVLEDRQELNEAIVLNSQDVGDIYLLLTRIGSVSQVKDKVVEVNEVPSLSLVYLSIIKLSSIDALHLSYRTDVWIICKSLQSSKITEFCLSV